MGLHNDDKSNFYTLWDVLRLTDQNKKQKKERKKIFSPVASVATVLTLLFFTSLSRPYKVALLAQPRPVPDISDPPDRKKSGGRLSTSLGKTVRAHFLAGEPSRGAARQQNINAVIYMKLLAYQRRNSICLTSAVQSEEE